MNNAIFSIPRPYNEPILSYAPGTAERSALKAELETKGTKQQTAERNQEIFCRYLSGIPVTVLAEEYFLSSKTIYSIIAKKKI